MSAGGFSGLTIAVHPDQRDAQVRERQTVFGRQVDGFLELLHGLGQLASRQIDGAQVVVGSGKLRIDGQRFKEIHDGLPPIALAGGIPPLVVCPHGVGRDLVPGRLSHDHIGCEHNCGASPNTSLDDMPHATHGDGPRSREVYFLARTPRRRTLIIESANSIHDNKLLFYLTGCDMMSARRSLPKSRQAPGIYLRRMGLRMFRQGNERMRTRSDRPEKLRQTAVWQLAVEPTGTHDDEGFDPIQLLEVAAHDLRNPISGILAAGQYLLDDAGYLLDEQHLALLQSIEASSRSMLRLIDDVIELSQIESGKLRLDVQTTDIQPLMNRALLQNQAAAERKKVQLDVEANGGALLPPIDIDPVRIFHAIDSLVSHTIKLARAGSKIEIGIGARAGKATISLSTDGCGMSPAGIAIALQPVPQGAQHPARGPRRHRPGVCQGKANHRSPWRCNGSPNRRTEKSGRSRSRCRSHNEGP